MHAGAGTSAESGIPTFREAGGLWRKYQATELATPEAFVRDPSLVWEFYHWRRWFDPHHAEHRPPPSGSWIAEHHRASWLSKGRLPC
ncbi:hypothetical protein WJX77_004064 [Trebouxia sp. C0004]